MAIKSPVVASHTHTGMGGTVIISPPADHHADHETGGSGAIAALAGEVITSGTLDGDRLPAISTSKKGAVPATGTPAGHFLRDDGAFVDLIKFGDAPASPYDGQLTQNLDATGAAGKFAMQLREHKWYTTLTPVIQYSKPTASSIKCLSTAASQGEGFVFVTLPKTYVHGKKVKLTWLTWDDHPSHSLQFFARITDGSYSRSSLTDFPTNNATSYLQKGAGALQTIENIVGINASHTATITANLAASTQTDVTIMIYLYEGNSAYQGYFIVESLEITDLSDVVEYSADLSGTLSMELEGTETDYGIIGAGVVGIPPDRTLKAWDTANSKWLNLAEPFISGGFSSQYRRGDKTWQTLNGLAVENTPAGNVAAVTVQAAINELDTEKEPALGNPASNGMSAVSTAAGVRSWLMQCKLTTKTDTGDPASGIEGEVCINTFDNNVKIYADGAWRSLVTW